MRDPVPGASHTSKSRKKAWLKRWKTHWIVLPRQSDQWKKSYRKSRFDDAEGQWVAEVIAHRLGFVEWNVFEPRNVTREQAYATGFCETVDAGKIASDDVAKSGVKKANTLFALRELSHGL